MHFACLELWAKNTHDMLVLLNTGKPVENPAFDVNFVVVLGAGEINDLNGGSGVGGFEAIFYFLW